MQSRPSVRANRSDHDHGRPICHHGVPSPRWLWCRLLASPLRLWGNSRLYVVHISGALPPGLSLSGATILGTPTVTGNFSLTLQATDSTSPTHQTATKALTLQINALPSVGIDATQVFWGGGGSQPAGTSTSYYSSTPQVFGSAYPFSAFAAGPDASISSVQVLLDGTAVATPAYATVSRADGCSLLGGPAWTGCPNIGFSYNFPASSYSQGAHTLSFRAIDTNGLVGTASFPITIVSTLGITTTSLPNALVSSPYSQALAATAGTAPYTWTLASGALPPGLSLSGSTISGTPTTAGTYNFTVQATDSSTPSHQSATQALSIYVNSPVSVATASLAGGLVTTAYSQSLAASGGTPGYTWSITTGALPNGLSLNSSGNIFGTPTTAGTANFTVQVTDSTSPIHQTATKALSITIGAALSITTSSLSTGLATTAYSQALAATGGTPAYTWSLASGSLPTGLTLSAAGTISGTPTAAGTFNFSVKTTDSTAPTAQTATQPLSITIGAAVSIMTASLPGALATTSYSQALAATGGTPSYTWSLASGSLPTGLSLSAAGTISGTPTAAGTFNFSVKATDSTAPTAQTATQPLSIIVGAAVTVTTTSFPNGLATSPYSQTLAASGGAPTYSWSIAGGSLPNGLSLVGATITGTPTAAGTYNFTVQVTDSTTPTHQTATQALTITVGAALSISTTTLPNALATAPYSQSLTATGGTPAYTWALVSGSLPTGLSLSAAGTISGTPVAGGSSTSPSRPPTAPLQHRKRPRNR